MHYKLIIIYLINLAFLFDYFKLIESKSYGIYFKRMPRKNIKIYEYREFNALNATYMREFLYKDQGFNLTIVSTFEAQYFLRLPKKPMQDEYDTVVIGIQNSKNLILFILGRNGNYDELPVNVRFIS